jgi:hypothetical protein
MLENRLGHNGIKRLVGKGEVMRIANKGDFASERHIAVDNPDTRLVHKRLHSVPPDACPNYEDPRITFPRDKEAGELSIVLARPQVEAKLRQQPQTGTHQVGARFKIGGPPRYKVVDRKKTTCLIYQNWNSINYWERYGTIPANAHERIRASNEGRMTPRAPQIPFCISKTSQARRIVRPTGVDSHERFDLRSLAHRLAEPYSRISAGACIGLRTVAAARFGKFLAAASSAAGSL